MSGHGEQGAAGAGPAHRVKRWRTRARDQLSAFPERAVVPLMAQRRIRSSGTDARARGRWPQPAGRWKII